MKNRAINNYLLQDDSYDVHLSFYFESYRFIRTAMIYISQVPNTMEFLSRKMVSEW